MATAGRGKNCGIGAAATTLATSKRKLLDYIELTWVLGFYVSIVIFSLSFGLLRGLAKGSLFSS